MTNKTFFIALATFLFGTGAVAQNVHHKELPATWEFKQARGNQWYAATVPGVVQWDLMKHGIIEDPFFRLNERSIQWVDKEDWEYRTTFDVAQTLFAYENLELDFKGLDTYADVFLNDSLILNANNMFREWKVDVKSLLKQEDNTLRVYFHSPIKVDMPKFDAIHYPIEAGNDQSENGGVLDKKLSVFARKAGYHYGWDWGPRIVTLGIWRPVFLNGWNSARVEDIHYMQRKVSARRAEVCAHTEITAAKATTVTLTISAEGAGVWSKKVALQEGKNTIDLNILVNNPRLWWSNGLGKANRYTFLSILRNEKGEILDSKRHTIGLRSIKVVNTKDAKGHSFYFELNGMKVFAKGANYIPQDNFLPRVTAAQYEQTILDAVRANMNMLRVWGGGIYEEDRFYDLCDKYGILVWQDFMFACSTYPMNPDMLENIRQEAIDNVTRLRNHASIALWCGNNENHTAWFNWGWWEKYEKLGVLDELRKDYKDVFHGILPEVVSAYDPTAFYWPSSPYGGDPDAPSETGKELWNPNGDGHYWGVWHAHDSIANYNHIRSRFFSEYGFQSFPEYQSVLKYAPQPQDHNIYSDVMMAHQRGGSAANALIEWYLLNEYSEPKDFPDFLYMGQLLQGDAIRTAIEAHRRDMPYCMGSLFWQHNDCWPVASWSSRDYYGRWKAQHYFARKAFAPILISPLQKNGNLHVYIVSERRSTIVGTLRVRVMSLTGAPIYEESVAVILPPNTSKVQFTQPISALLHGAKPNEVVINASFSSEQEGVKAFAANYFLTRHKDINFPQTKIRHNSVARGDGFDVTLTSSAFARGVFMSVEGDNFFSDNYIDLLPNESVTVHVRTKLPRSSFDKLLLLQSVNNEQ